MGGLTITVLARRCDWAAARVASPARDRVTVIATLSDTRDFMVTAQLILILSNGSSRAEYLSKITVLD